MLGPDIGRDGRPQVAHLGLALGQQSEHLLRIRYGDRADSPAVLVEVEQRFHAALLPVFLGDLFGYDDVNHWPSSSRCPQSVILPSPPPVPTAARTSGTGATPARRDPSAAANSRRRAAYTSPGG